MDRIEDMFTLLHTLINFTSESTVSINKSTLIIVLTCLQFMHKKVDKFKIHNTFVSNESTLLQNQHPDFIHLQHNPLFGLAIGSEQDRIEYVPVMNQIKEFDVNDEDELHGDTQIIYDDTKVNYKLKENEDKLNEVPKRTNKDADKFEDVTKIVVPWGELQLERNQYGLRCEKDVDNIFHTINYGTPITFVSNGFVDVDK